jgi:hypothetical protein
MSENTPNVEVNAAFNEAQPDAAAEMASENTLKDAMSEKAAAEGNVDKSENNDDQFASKFAALSRREKELRDRQAEIEAKYNEYEAWKAEREAEANNKEPELPLEYRLKKDPLNALAELGLSYDKLTELALNDGKLTPDMQMELMKRELEEQYNSKFETLKEELESYKAQQEEAKYEETINGFMNELTEFVNNGDNSYDLIRATDAVDLVYEEIENHYNNTGEILEMDKAAEAIEAQLREEYEQMLAKNAEKFGYTKAQQEAIERKISSTPTLSNSQTSTVSTNGERPLSNEESKAAAANLIKWMD